LKKIKEYLHIIILLIIILLIIFGFWIFRRSFIISIKEFSVFYSFIATGIIAYVTFLYFLATKRIANKTSESVEASRKLSETTVQIEKDRLTYELIKEWSYDKKLLTLRIEGVCDIVLSGEFIIHDLKKSFKIIEYFNNFYDYFTIVRELIKNDKINKELYFKVLSRQIVGFMKDEYKINHKILSHIQYNFNKSKVGYPISTYDGLKEVVWLAEEEIKPGTHENYF